jgi:FlaA1/EpsC-like NDP-sugar epimerase
MSPRLITTGRKSCAAGPAPADASSARTGSADNTRVTVPHAPQPHGDRTLPPAVVLVGTAATLRELRHLLALADPAPAVAGEVVIAAQRCGESAVGGAVRERLAATPYGGSQPPVEVLVCLPRAMSAVVAAVRAAAAELDVRTRPIATLADQLAGRAFGPAAAVEPSALLDRTPRPLDTQALSRLLTGRSVLISGAGGSIGGQLAHVVASFKPGRLVLMERGENALFEIDRKLAAQFPGVPRVACLHDVTHAGRTHELLAQHRPDLVLHAAAHKHVPVMEDHPADAVENNFYGTRNLADAADAAGVARFVMISTDKAVNPSSVMGATKRLAELYIQHKHRHGRTRFAMVRFGNVLGSACSVLPIWTDQLAHGGPLTVTDPRMTRYFMTIPEAAGLVLQAAAISTDDDPDASVFLLDMGEPIRVLDMAERFLRAQGLEPGVDVPIRITGPRPGEKLFEELAYDREDLVPTRHPAVRRWRTAAPTDAAMQQVIRTFDRLRQSHGAHPWSGTTPAQITTALRALIPEMVLPAALAG